MSSNNNSYEERYDHAKVKALWETGRWSVGRIAREMHTTEIMVVKTLKDFGFKEPHNRPPVRDTKKELEWGGLYGDTIR